MEIDLDTLQKASERLFAHVRSIGYARISIDGDFYWSVRTDVKYDPTSIPSESALSLGQLSYDFERIIMISQEDDAPISYGFVWLAALLQAIGETVPE